MRIKGLDHYSRCVLRLGSGGGGPSCTFRFRDLAYRSDLRKRRDGLSQRFGANVSVMRAHRLGIVPDELHDYALRDPGILEQAHGCAVF